MTAFFNSKTFKWISFCIYFLALLGLASIVFESPSNQVPRFQYKNISPNGLVRTIIDYAQVIALLMLMANTARNYQFNKILVFASIFVYALFTLIDVNTWLFFTNEDALFYIFIIAFQAMPLVIFLYRWHIFKKEHKGILITGIIAMLVGFSSHYYFYHLALTRKFRSGYYYDYPALLKTIGWFCLIGILFTIVAAMEAVNNHLHNKKQELILSADNSPQA